MAKNDVFLFPTKVKSSKSKIKHKEMIFIIAMLAIPFLNWAIWWCYINISTFALAFQYEGKFSLINFEQLLAQITMPVGDDNIAISLINTCKYFAVNLFVCFPLCVIVSYFLSKRVLGYKAFRAIFFLPVILSGVTMTTVFSAFISPDGPLGQICKWFNISYTEGFLNGPKTATNAILVYTVWTGLSTNVILISSAITRIPTEILESANLEGCGLFRELVSIILPMIWSTLSTLLVFILTSVFNASGPILLFAPDGEHQTSTLAFWIFKQVYGTGAVGGTGNYGLVSCAGLCFTIIGVPIITFIRKMFDKIPAVEY